MEKINKKLNGAVNSAVNWCKKYLDCDADMQFTFEGTEYRISNEQIIILDSDLIRMTVTREGVCIAIFQYTFETAEWKRYI